MPITESVLFIGTQFSNLYTSVDTIIIEKKLRCIANANPSLSNISEYTYETVPLCPFSLAGHVASTVHRIFAEKGWSTPAIIMGR